MVRRGTVHPEARETRLGSNGPAAGNPRRAGPTIRVLNGAWRHHLAAMAASARRSILVASPYIKDHEANWLCKQLQVGVEVITLANINAEAVSGRFLDLAALKRLAEASASAKLFALPRLHAKVFVADGEAAIVTSGNLTTAGLEGNLEYGVLIEAPELALTVQNDMLALTMLGCQVEAATIARLLPIEERLREARAHTNDLARALQEARSAFLEVQLGNRSARAMFADAIRFVLTDGPKATKAIEREVSGLMPDLCDDSDYIRGKNYGKAWKLELRRAQRDLKRRGEIVGPDQGTWALSQQAQRVDDA